MNEASQYSKTSSTVKHTELFHPVGYIPPVTPFQILPLRNFHHSSSGKPLTVLKKSFMLHLDSASEICRSAIPQLIHFGRRKL